MRAIADSQPPVVSAQNIAGLRKVIVALTPAQSGSFLRCDGAIVPW